MSFKCDFCNESQPAGVSVTPVVVEQRNQFYENVIKREDENGKDRRITIESSGWEIVSEKKACQECKEANDLRTV